MATATSDVLSQYARVVEEIQAALASGDALDWNLLYDPAAEYALACDSVNQRLKACAALLEKGLRGEALQEAERDPPLLEACSTLDFPELPQWRAALAAAQMPLPLAVNMDLAAQLNAAYGIYSGLEKLLQRHRLLALCRAPLPLRIQTLRALVAADPDNPAWKEDLQELEFARQQELRRELSEAVRAKDLARAEALLAELTSSPWAHRPGEPTLLEARSAVETLQRGLARSRLETLAHQLNAAHAELEETAGMALLPEWEMAVRVAGLAAEDPLLEKAAPALRWLQERCEARENRRQFEQGLAEWEAALDEAGPREELERLYAKVLRLQPVVEDATIPPRLLRRHQERLQVLEAAARRRFLVAWTGVVLALLLAAAGVAYGLRVRQHRQQVQEAVLTLRRLLDEDKLPAADELHQRLRRQQPALLTHPQVAEQVARLTQKQQEEQTRRATLARLLETLQQADLEHADRSLLDEAQSLAKTPDEKEQVAQWKARLATYDRLKQQQRDQQFQEELTPLLNEMEVLEKQLSAEDLIDPAQISLVRSKLDALNVRADRVSPPLKDQLRPLQGRLTAIARQADQLRSQREGLRRVTQAVGQPQRFLEALTALVDQHPTLPGASEMRRVLQEEAAWWGAVEQWRPVLQDEAWSRLDRLTPLQARQLLDRMKPLLGQGSPVPPARWAESKTPLLKAFVAREEASVRPRVRELETLLNQPWMRDLWALRTSTLMSTKTYYLQEKEHVQSTEGGLLRITYVTDLRLRTHTVTRSEKTEWLRRAPQAELSRNLREQALPKLRDGPWEEGIWNMIELVLDQADLDPVLGYILLSQIVELGQQTSFSVQQALQPLAEALRQAAVDQTVEWILPDHPQAQRAREEARRLFQVLNRQRDEWKQALSRRLADDRAPAPPLPQWVGWLCAEGGPTENRYRCEFPDAPPKDGLLWVLAEEPSGGGEPGTSRSNVKWIEVGDIRGGRLVWKGASRPHLRAGRPVYYSGAKETTRTEHLPQVQ